MRPLIAAFALVLVATQIGSAEGAPADTPLMPGGAPQGMATLAPLVKKVTPSVVNLATKGRVAQERNPLLNDPFFRRFFNVPDLPTERELRAAGSGVIVDAGAGLVVTSNHVVEHADEITVTLADRRRLRAKRVGADPDTDVAVIKIAADGLTALPLGDSETLEVGDFVVAIGNPFGLGQTVTSGIVSALRRSGLGLKGYEDFIQTDAPINPGNSGGALVNLRGELIGINTAIVAPGGGNVGIGFAIPSNMVRDVMDQLVKFGEVRRGQLGVMVQDLTPDLAEAMGLPSQQMGAVIAKVESGSAAERAALKVGDVITELAKAPIRGSANLRNKVGLLRVGEVAELTVLRGGRSLTVRVTLIARLNTALRGGELSPLLEGAAFGATGSGAPASGVEIVSVEAASRASAAGLRKGDIITSVNQKPVTRPEELAAQVKQSPMRLLLNVAREDSALFIFLQ
jgi:serine protease Do/serine protease DegQ